MFTVLVLLPLSVALVEDRQSQARALIAQIFGVRYLSTLSGCAFMFHQAGSFLGVWLGGRIFDTTGSDTLMWRITIVAGLAAALLTLPVDEREISRTA